MVERRDCSFGKGETMLIRIVERPKKCRRGCRCEKTDKRKLCRRGKRYEPSRVQHGHGK